MNLFSFPKRISILLLCMAPLVLHAQKTEKWREAAENYLLGTLTGKSAEMPHTSFSAKHLSAFRHMVWKAWQTANSRFAEEKLPEMDSLAAGKSFQWQIPEELEPKATMPFYWGYKGDKPTAGYPCFLYLHGSGSKVQEWATGLALGKRFADAPSVYFIPQIPNEGQWYRWWQKGKQFVWDKLLRQTLLRNDINANRLYVFGISEGGYGSQRLASFYADYWAAAGPMAGGEPLKNAPAENLANTAFSLRTGAKDKGFYRDKLTRYTAEALDSLENLNPAAFRHHVELIPGYGHAIDYTPTTPWLSHFTRNPWPKHFIWEDFDMDGLHRKGFYNLMVNERPDKALRTRYDVNITDNVVTLAVENVVYETVETDPVYGIELKFSRKYTPARSGKITLFLNEHLVDLSRPVTVMLNGRRVFQGIVRMKLENMLHATSVFYDPERLYPAAIQIELK